MRYKRVAKLDGILFSEAVAGMAKAWGVPGEQNPNGNQPMAKCPHCKKPVSLSAKSQSAAGELPVRKEVVGMVKKEVMYFCPHCDCILGFGFYLGGLLTGRP